MISIIVPVYNGEAYLHTCLDSILNNSFRDYELIVVENGSTDKTLEVAHAYEARDNRVRVVSSGKGVSCARNLGIEMAKGEFVAFVDADDYISQYMFECLYNAICAENGDLAVCGYVKGTETDHAFPSHETVPPVVTSCTLDEYCRRLYLGGDFAFSIVCNKLFRRSIIGDLRFDETMRFCEDRYFICQYIVRIQKVAVIDEPFYYYWRGNGDSISLTADQYCRMELLYGLQKELRFVEENKQDKLLWQECISLSLLQNADFRLNRVKERKMADLEAELKTMIKDAARRVRHAKHLPRKVKLRALLEHDFPHLFLLASKILG